MSENETAKEREARWAKNEKIYSKIDADLLMVAARNAAKNQFLAVAAEVYHEMVYVEEGITQDAKECMDAMLWRIEEKLIDKPGAE